MDVERVELDIMNAIDVIDVRLDFLSKLPAKEPRLSEIANNIHAQLARKKNKSQQLVNNLPKHF